MAGVRQAGAPLVGLGSSMEEAKQDLEAFLFAGVYRHWRVNRVFHRARRMLRELFAFFCDHPDCLPDEHQARIADHGLGRTVADYIAGMTDRFAEECHAQI